MTNTKLLNYTWRGSMPHVSFQPAPLFFPAPLSFFLSFFQTFLVPHVFIWLFLVNSKLHETTHVSFHPAPLSCFAPTLRSSSPAPILLHQMFCTNLLTGPQPSRDDWCKNCPPEIAEQVSSPGGLLAGIFLHPLELLEEGSSDLNVQRQDSTPSFFCDT